MRTVKILMIAVFALGLVAAVAGDNTYIGASKCKMCHKVQFASWSETPHAKALDKLKPEEQAKAECLKCHATGDSAEMPGVQCESCHGAGSGYKSMKIMKDTAAATAAGLVKPEEALCVSCHEGAPHDQAEFVYAEAVKTGLHEFKSEE